MKKKLIAGAVLAASLFASAAHAAPVFFTDRTAFEAATSGLSFQGFEDSQTGPTVTYPGFTATETGGVNFITNTNVNSVLNAVTEGAGAIWYDDNGGSILTFAFNAALNAFGVDLTTSGPSTINIMSSAFDTNVDVSGNFTFFGVIADSNFSSVVFNASGGPNVGFDALAYGTSDGVVPLPASGLLLAGAIGMLGLRRRKKRS